MWKYALKGENNPKAKITNEDVIMILDLYEKTGNGCRRLAKLTGIPYTTIYPILAGKSWKHITGGKKCTVLKK